MLLINNSDNKFIGNQGDRIAQLILEKIATPETKTVKAVTETK